MDYYELLNLKKEPFSNSPDPNYLFQSRQHRLCLQRLELSVRLKRGLNVVVGEVGTGKTTLCRQLLVKFGADDTFKSYLILEPQVASPTEFLQAVAVNFDAERTQRAATDAALKEIIKNHLFQSGVEAGHTNVLIIDEGQKMPPFCLEIIRELLNYETNEHKLLQIIVFAQPEFDTILAGHANVADRISLRHELKPMGFRDTQLMIAYRLYQAGLSKPSASPFTFWAVVAIYLASKGYPRKIVNLCHQCVLALLIQNRKRAGWRLVRSCVRRMRMDSENRLGKASWAMGIAVLAVLVAAAVLIPRFLATREMPAPTAPAAETAVHHGTPPLQHIPPVAATDVQAPPEASSEVPAAAPIPRIGGAAEAAPVVPPSTTLAAAETFPETAASPKAGDDAPPVAPVAASIEKPPEPVSQAVVAAPPDFLGTARLKRKEMLSWLMIKVYGVYSKDLLNRLLTNNPKIDNPDNIFVGARIVFPAFPVSSINDFNGHWWASIGDTDHFDEALGMVRNHPAALRPVRIIPYWRADMGLRFRVVMWEHFLSEADAMAAVSTLQRNRISAAMVVDGWPDNAVLYADPFSGTIN